MKDNIFNFKINSFKILEILFSTFNNNELHLLYLIFYFYNN